MALSDEEKVAVGVCAGVGGLILIGIILFICIVFWRNRDKSYVHHKKRYIHEDRHFYNDRPYTVLEDYKTPPPFVYGPPKPPSYRYVSPPPTAPVHIPLPPPPPPPPPPPVREVREVVYRKPEPLHEPPVYVKYGADYVHRQEPRRVVEKVYRGDYVVSRQNEPIVIPLSEPDYLYSGYRIRSRPQTHYIRYHDDQALLRTGYDRKEYGELRRVHSFGDLRHSTRPYVGEWVAKSSDLGDFNRDAFNKGRDPFLWKNSNKEYDYARRYEDRNW